MTLGLTNASAAGRETDGGPAIPTPVIKRLFRRSHHGAKLIYVTRSPLLLGPTYAGVIYRPKGGTGFRKIDLAVYHERRLLKNPTVGQRGLLSPAARWKVAEHGAATMEIVVTETYPGEEGEPSRTITHDAKGSFDWSFTSRGGEVIDLGDQDGGPLSGDGNISGGGTVTTSSVEEPDRDSTCHFAFKGEPTNSNYEPQSKPGPKGRRERVYVGLGEAIELELTPGAASECSVPGPPELPSDADAAFSVVVPQAPWTSPIGGPVGYHFHSVKNRPDVLAHVTEETTLDLSGTGSMQMTGFE